MRKVIILLAVVSLVLVSGCTNGLNSANNSTPITTKNCGADVSCLNESFQTCAKTNFEKAEMTLLGNFVVNISILGKEKNGCSLHYTVNGIPSEKTYEERTCFVPVFWDYQGMASLTKCVNSIDDAWWECTADNDCSDWRFCDSDFLCKLKENRCETDDDCQKAKEYCDIENHECKKHPLEAGECFDDEDCTPNHCAILGGNEKGTCVECTNNSHCSNHTYARTCDSNKCVECTGYIQCTVNAFDPNMQGAHCVDGFCCIDTAGTDCPQKGID